MYAYEILKKLHTNRYTMESNILFRIKLQWYAAKLIPIIASEGTVQSFRSTTILIKLIALYRLYFYDLGTKRKTSTKNQ